MLKVLIPFHRNLYEEGKVCLSILGTWTGDKSESWSASRSSLLQALVSIQGLVLVKEPCVYIKNHKDVEADTLLRRWYCEPAYEKLRGTEEGAVNRWVPYLPRLFNHNPVTDRPSHRSRLYSEKAFVLSRNFVRRALEIPLGGFAAVSSCYAHPCVCLTLAKLLGSQEEEEESEEEETQARSSKSKKAREPRPSRASINQMYAYS